MKKTILTLLVGLLAMGCTEMNDRPGDPHAVAPTDTVRASTDTYWVSYRGALRTVMHQGDLTPHVHLDTLAHLSGLYAVGPLEGMVGEVTIYDGEPSIATVQNGEPRVSTSFDARALFLVYGAAEGWTSLRIDEHLEDLASLEQFISEAAEEVGLSTDAPFPFRLEGTAASLTYHILDHAEGEPIDHARHQDAKIIFEVSDRASRMVGFWGPEEAQGIYVHRDEHIHIHAMLPDDDASGHVDALTIEPGTITLYLPVP